MCYKRIFNFLFLISGLFISLHASAQHGHAAGPDDHGPLSFMPVLAQKLSDPELKNYTMESVVMTAKAGGVDSIPHKHDAELFGYILDGQLEVRVGDAAPKIYKKGEMFYEPRNITHYSTRNSDSQTDANILLVFIIKTGRERKAPVSAVSKVK